MTRCGINVASSEEWCSGVKLKPRGHYDTLGQPDKRFHKSMLTSSMINTCTPGLQPRDTESWLRTIAGRKQVSCHTTSLSTHQSWSLPPADTLYLWKWRVSHFLPLPTQMSKIFTIRLLHSSGSSPDQLNCRIPNRIFPINLVHAGITNWCEGLGGSQPSWTPFFTNISLPKPTWLLCLSGHFCDFSFCILF